MTVTERASLPAVIDPADWPELSYRLDLTDGLPTFPPQREVVEALVLGSGLPGDTPVGAMPPSGRMATVRDIAANGAMAGCLPEHMPVVLAAFDAMQEPRFNMAGVVATTHPCWPLVIVSGSAVERLGMATGESLFSGGGSRANLAIGRAVKLAIWNIGGGRPHRPVQEILGHPGRLAFCIAESSESPWAPFHESRDLNSPYGAVTVFACESPQIANPWGFTTNDNPRLGEQWLGMVADQMSARGNSNTHTMGEALVVFTPSFARTLASQGWTRERVQEQLWQTARRRLGDIRMKADGSPAVDAASRYDWWPDTVDQSDPETRVPVAWSPHDIHIVVSGADSIPCAAILPSWGHLGGFATTRALPAPASSGQEGASDGAR
jgi:hypothetical protein